MQARDPNDANYNHAHLLVINSDDASWLHIQKVMAHHLSEVVATRAKDYGQMLDLLSEWLDDERTIPKMILLDLDLPNRQVGLQVLSDLRELAEPFNRIPVLVFSISELQADINEAYSRGCSAYLVRPSALPEWHEHIRQVRAFWWETVTLPSMHQVF